MSGLDSVAVVEVNVARTACRHLMRNVTHSSALRLCPFPRSEQVLGLRNSPYAT